MYFWFALPMPQCLPEAGYVGEDVESILTRLLQSADYSVAIAGVELYLLMR